MNKSTALTILLSTFLLPCARAADLLRTARDVYLNVADAQSANSTFDVEGVVTFTRQEDDHVLFTVQDATGDTPLNLYRDLPVRLEPGMKIKATGKTIRDVPFREAVATALTVLGKEAPPRPEDTNGADLLDGKVDCRLVRISGIVNDYGISELNANWAFLVINSQGKRTYVSVSTREMSADRLSELVDSEISAVGICLPFDCTFRAHMGRVFKVSSARDIHTVNVRPSATNDLPRVESIGNMPPLDIALLGRHRAIGHVVAAWDGSKILIRTPGGHLSQVEVTTGTLPEYGQLIEARGFPETDLFQINLTHASWNLIPGDGRQPDDAQFVEAGRLLSTTNGALCIDRYFHGRAIRCRGRVISAPTAESPNRTLYLASGSHVVPVASDAVSDRLADIPVGSLIEVSGTCVMETEPWRPNMIFTRTRGLTLVTRNRDDVQVLARPSWWTSGRLAIVTIALFVLLFAIVVWNVSLRRLSDRKGRELAKATLARSESALKVQERTRLATELHDSIAQNLTGASLHLRTADKIGPGDHVAMRLQLAIALRTINSCRDEIRNCIWDLRSRALDEPTMDAAIRRTLHPHVDGCDLAIRFAVSRRRLSDNMAHTIICVVRELVLNALRHGKANAIRIAGQLEDGRLLFSVTDNGSGFDPEAAPGIEQGHFGLQGIRERVDQLQGEFTLASKTGRGTKAMIAFQIPEENKL